LEFAQVNSAEVFTSYGGIEMKLIVHDFKVKIGDKVQMNHYPTNLYRDDEAKNYITSFISD
jgi:co-chaperonin GroES (HSP10)